MEVLIAGDFCPQHRVKRLFEDGQYCQVLDGVKPVIEKADYSIVNFECSITESQTKPIFKQGPSLKCGKEAIRALQYVGVDCVSLANNHFRDYGDKGCQDTITALTSENIDYVGGGTNIGEASEILYKTIGEETIAIINCCEHEFSIAENDSAGANPHEPITQYYQISEAKQRADYVIMIIHGGVEHFQYPTKRMVHTYRFYVNAGADAVINHHQHCPCGYEVYKGKPIYYGLGNFCFDWEGRRNSIWNLGYMVNLKFTSEHRAESEIIPFRQCDETASVELLKGGDLEFFNQMMVELCDAIKEVNVLNAKLKEFNMKNDFLYRKMLEPYSGRLANSLYRRRLLPTTLSKDRILALIDFVVCESHYERVKEFLDREYNKYFNEQN